MSKIIHNLKEFLVWRGFAGNDPYNWARCFYKYTDCGPWAVFMVKTRDAHETEHPAQVATFRKENGTTILCNPRELTPDFIQFLGFDSEGLSKKERTWSEYNRLIDAFIKDELKQVRTGRALQLTYRTHSDLIVTLPGCTKSHPIECDEIYYEDMRGDQRFMEAVDNTNCAGIKFGSIVEGSESSAGPYTHMFPFEAAHWTRDEDHMEAETSYFWKRDNAIWYNVRADDNSWIVADVWGDIEWQDGVPPSAIHKLAEEAIHNAEEAAIPEMPGIYEIKPEHDDWKALPLGDTGAEIYSFTNDTMYD